MLKFMKLRVTKSEIYDKASALMFNYVCCMTDEQTAGVSNNTNITPEMRLLFLSLGVNSTKCYECGKSGDVTIMDWENDCMWFICPTCKKVPL